MAERSEEAEPGIIFGEAAEEEAASVAAESVTEGADPVSEEQGGLVLVESEEAESEAAVAEDAVLDFTAAPNTDDEPSVSEAKDKKPVNYERFDKVNSERKQLRTQVQGLTTEREQLTTRVTSLEEELEARPATAPAWFNKLYGEWDQPEEVARIDHVIAEILNENARVPIYRDVIEDIKAKMAEKEIKMGDRAPERVVEEQDEKPAKKKGEAREAKPQSEGWAGKAVMRGTVRQVLERGDVKPELRKTIEDAVLPKLMTLDDEPTEAIVIAEVRKFVKEQGWPRDFLVASKVAQRKAPPTGGVRGVATVQGNASPEKKGSSDAEADAAAGTKAPESSDEWSHRQKRKMLTAFGSLTDAQKKGEESPQL